MVTSKDEKDETAHLPVSKMNSANPT